MKKKPSELELPPRKFIGEYEDAEPHLRLVRMMQRFMNEVVDADPELRKHYSELHIGYMDMLEKELASHGFLFALAITELEERYPQIRRDAERDSSKA